MASLITPPTDQAYVTGEAAMAQIGTLTASSHTSSPAPQATPLIDSLTVLSSESAGGHVVGGAKDGGVVSLSHVLSGLQGEEDLAEVLQEQPNLSHGECRYLRGGLISCRQPFFIFPLVHKENGWLYETPGGREFSMVRGSAPNKI